MKAAPGIIGAPQHVVYELRKCFPLEIAMGLVVPRVGDSAAMPAGPASTLVCRRQSLLNSTATASPTLPSAV